MLESYIGALHVRFPVNLRPPPNEQRAKLVIQSMPAYKLLPDCYAIDPYKARFHVINP
jgi:hypothetical protein